MGAFNGSGVFVRSYSWTQDAANAIDITASRVDTEDTGFASGLSLCVTRDGQGAMAADFLPNADNTLNLGSTPLRWASFNGVASSLVIPTSGSFTGTFTGFTTVVTGTCQWAKAGNVVVLYFPVAFGTSNATGFTMTGMPATIQPATLTQLARLPDSSVQNFGIETGDVDAQIAPGGTITFIKAGNFANWTNSGQKGFVGASSIAYLTL